MAYADIGRKRSFSPASLGGAMLANGGLIALIVFAAPHVIGTIPEEPIDVIHISIKPITNKSRPKERDHRPPAASLPNPDNNTHLVDRVVDKVIPNPTDTLTPGPLFPSGGGTLVQPFHRPILTGAIVHPNYRGQLQPAYPPGLARAGVEGAATIRVLIGIDGRVKTVEAIRSNEEEFLMATREQALRKWRFKPAMEDGVPVESWREMTVRFVMPR